MRRTRHSVDAPEEPKIGPAPVAPRSNSRQENNAPQPRPKAPEPKKNNPAAEITKNKAAAGSKRRLTPPALLAPSIECPSSPRPTPQRASGGDASYDIGTQSLKQMGGGWCTAEPYVGDEEGFYRWIAEPTLWAKVLAPIEARLRQLHVALHEALDASGFVLWRSFIAQHSMAQHSTAQHTGTSHYATL